MRGSLVLQGILLGFLGGMLAGSFFDAGMTSALLLFASGIASLFLFSRRVGEALFLATLFFTPGLFLFHEERAFWANLPEETSFAGTVTVIGIEESKVFYRPVTLRPLGSSDFPTVDMLYRAPITFEVLPGDIFSFRCELVRPKNFDEYFDYRSFLATRNIGYVCERGEELMPKESSAWSLSRGLFLLRERVAYAVRQALPEPTAGLALGLILGGNDFLGQETKDIFARTGLSHIVAVSGYNMTILVQFCLILGLSFGLWRKQALIVSALAIVLFLLLIGAPASAVRAALMTGVGFGAFFFGRLPASYNALFLAATLMLLGNPLLLRFDVGFELSFLATLAILVGSPLLETFLPLKKLWAKIVSLFLFTIIIELFTLPVLFVSFGQATWLAPLTNLLILPLVPIAMLFALLLLPFILLLPTLAPFIAFPLWGVLAFQLKVATFFSDLPFGLIHFRELDLFSTLAWYALVMIFFFFLYRLKKRYVLGMAH